MKAGQPTWMESFLLVILSLLIIPMVLMIHPVMTAKAGKKTHAYAFSRSVLCTVVTFLYHLLFYLQDINK